MRRFATRVLMLSMAFLTAGCLLAACGGGGEGSEAPGTGMPPAGQPPQAASADLSATSLMDWAEQAYAAFFPGHQANQTYGPYTYRFYGNGNYLAVASDQVYIMGPVSGGNAPVLVASLAQFTCRALPQNCAASGSLVSGTAIGKGTALAGATVLLRDIAGVVRSATTSASGTYTLDVSGLAPPFVVSATGRDASGATAALVSIGRQGGGLTQTVNLTPWTTALAAMLSPTGKAAGLDAARDRTRITGTLTTVINYSRTLLAPSLTDAGVSASAYDPITAPLTVNGAGVAALYGRLTVGTTDSNAIFMADANASPCSPAQLGGCVRYTNPGAQTTTNPNVCGSDIATGAPIPCDASLPTSTAPSVIAINPSQAYSFGCLGCVFWGPADNYAAPPTQTPVRVTTLTAVATPVVPSASTWYAHFSATACAAGICVSQGGSTGITTYDAQAACQTAAALVAQTLNAAAIAGLSYSFTCSQTP